MGILTRQLLLTSDLSIHIIGSLPLFWLQQPPSELSLTLVLFCHFLTFPSSTPFPLGSFHRVATYTCKMHVCVFVYTYAFFFFSKILLVFYAHFCM